MVEDAALGPSPHASVCYAPVKIHPREHAIQVGAYRYTGAATRAKYLVPVRDGCVRSYSRGATTC